MNKTERPLSSQILYTLHNKATETGDLEFIDLGRRISRMLAIREDMPKLPGEKEVLALQAIKGFKVTDMDHIAEIYQAKKDIIQLAANWLDAIREDQQGKAAQIRRRSNTIKRDIRVKYDILID